MPLYMTQYSYTPEALEHMINTDEDRTAAIDAHMKQIGGRLISVYYSLGDYHAFSIYEAPTGSNVLSLVTACESAGFVKSIKTTEIFSADEGLEIFKKARELTIHPPKS